MMNQPLTGEEGRVSPANSASKLAARSAHAARAHEISEVFDVSTDMKVLESGEVLKIDRAVLLDGLAILAGWRTKNITISIDDSFDEVKYRRMDVEEHFGDGCAGFLIVVNCSRREDVHITFHDGHRKYATRVTPVTERAEIDIVMEEQKPRLHRIIPILSRSRNWGLALNQIVSSEPCPQARGFIDKTLLVEGAGAAVIGWALPANASNVYLVTSSGVWRSLREAETVPRPDVTTAFAPDFGDAPHPSGFYACLAGRFTANEGVFLIVANEGGLFMLAEAALSATKLNAVDFARQTLALPTPMHRFVNRLRKLDLPLLEVMTRRQNAGFEELPQERWNYGPPPVTPTTSVIVPLYGRWDFLEHQLLEFARDEDFATRVELLYVIDDFNVVEPLLAQAAEIYELYNVSFSLLWGQANRGYSGANNLGARAARGDYLIFLNSDVFPEAPGWSSDLIDLLENNPSVGLVAPRLTFPDGGLQHVGIEFRYDETHQVWLNEHPLLGLPPEVDLSRELVERQAVTGACMTVRRAQFLELGGFDPGYLIGDFEDTDLCLKYRSIGLTPAYTPQVTLTHLERQSFKGIGADDFRQRVVIYNAVRHFARWGKRIEQLAARSRLKVTL